MSDLAQLQDRTARALLDGNLLAISEAYRVTGADQTRRLAIYRNNMFFSLTTALQSMFPVTALLADQRFFGYAANAYITANPPREARLSLFGQKFPAFLAGFVPCRPHPVIAQMAALEWAIAASLDEPEIASLPLSAIATLPEQSADCFLSLQPNLRFAISRFDLVSLWADHKASAGEELRPLRRKSSRIAVLRHDDDLGIMELDTARFIFWRELARGASLEQASNRATAREPLFDVVVEVLLLFRSGLVVGVARHSTTH